MKYLAVTFILLCIAQTARAQHSPHRVRLAPRINTTSNATQRWYPRPLSTQTGNVLQLDADQLSIVLTGQNAPTRFAARRVLDIELTTVPQEQDAAIRSFKQGDFKNALPALVRCVSDQDPSDRPPVWRQQWLSMLAAQAAMRSGRGDIALELVGQLDARPLPTMTLGLLPIDWTGMAATHDHMMDVAAERAGSKSLAVKLVVASWLLRSPKYRPAAEAAVRRLTAQQDRKRISTLAGQLRWRTKTPPEVEAGLQRWENEIDQLPMALQTGPMISLLHLVRQAGLKNATKKWELTIEHAAPTWHPGL